MAPRWGAAVLRPYCGNLVAGYRFGGFFFFGGSVAIAVAVAVAVGMAITTGMAVAAGWGDAYRLACVGEVGWNRLGDVAYRANLHYRGLGLLQHQFFVDGADLGLLFVRLFATG